MSLEIVTTTTSKGFSIGMGTMRGSQPGVVVLLSKLQASGELEWLGWAIDIQGKMDEAFWDDEGKGYFQAQAGDPFIKTRSKEDYDGAEPAGEERPWPG